VGHQEESNDRGESTTKKTRFGKTMLKKQELGGAGRVTREGGIFLKRDFTLGGKVKVVMELSERECGLASGCGEGLKRAQSKGKKTPASQTTL